MEAQSVFGGYVGVESADNIVVLGVEMGFVGQGGFRLIVHVADTCVRQFHQSVGDDVACEVHSGGVGLKYGRRSVDVHYQSGKKITFTVDKPECVVIGAPESECPPQGVCLGEAGGEEITVDNAVGEIEHAYGYAAYLEVPYAYYAAVGCGDTYDVAFLYAGIFAGHLCQRTGKHPGMEAVERFFLTPAQAQYGIAC